MADFTPNYNLKKPLRTEYYDVADANGNSDIVDTQLKAVNDRVDLVEGEVDALELGKADKTYVDAQLADKANAFFVQNLVNNSGFKNGSVSWVATSGAIVGVINRELNINTPINTTSSLSCSTFAHNPSNKYFAYARVKTDKPADVYIQLFASGYPQTPSITSVPGEYIEIYGFLSAVDTRTSTYSRIRTVATEEPVNTTVDGLAGVFLIEMTQYGIDDFTTNEMLLLVKSLGQFDGNKPATNELMRVMIKRIRDNRNAIISLGGTI